MAGDDSTRARWGRFRFSIVGPLLASPPEHGDLQSELKRLAERSWKHPTTGEAVRFSVKTIERWLYIARNQPSDPVGALARKTHARAGSHPSVSPRLAELIFARHRAHPKWSYQLHFDNLRVLVEQHDWLGTLPSYQTISRRPPPSSAAACRRRGRT